MQNINIVYSSADRYTASDIAPLYIDLNKAIKHVKYLIFMKIRFE